MEYKNCIRKTQRETASRQHESVLRLLELSLKSTID